MTKVARPADWGKEKILELVADESDSLRGHLRRIAGPMGVGWHALFAEIERWKMQDEDFRQAYLEVMGDRTKRGGGVLKFTEEKRAQFLEDYLDTGQMEAPALKAGMSPSTIRSMCSPNHLDYDPFFAEEMARVKAQLVTRMADGLVGDIQTARLEGDVKTSINGTKFYLERQDPDNWSRRVEQRIEHTGEVKHTHQISASEAQAQLAADMQRAFGDGEPPLQIEAEVVRGAG